MPAKKSKSTRDKSILPALNTEKRLSPQPHLPEILQKGLSPHETSLKCLPSIQKKKNLKSTDNKSKMPAELTPLSFFAPCGNMGQMGPDCPPWRQKCFPPLLLF